MATVDAVTETLTVRELCTTVGASISAAFPDEVWVKGAISSLSRSGNGHVYFDLVEPSDDLGASTSLVVPVALFASDRQRVNAILRKSGAVRMTEGLEIRIRGRVAYYPPQGRIQLVMSLIDPAYTMGQMALARQNLLDRLRTEGVLAANQALAFPPLPLRVALVTSEGSAAHADFVNELELSGYPFHLTLFDSRVQGIDAVPGLVGALDAAGTAAVDVVVVVRGGGARTDLAAFDHEQVARAVIGCPYPVVVGVGHETDRSVADEVANVSAKTPTASAVVLVNAVRRADEEVEVAAERLVVLADRRLDQAATTLDVVGRRLATSAAAAMSRNGTMLERRATHLDHRHQRLLDRAAASLDNAEVRLRALDPALAMARGWTITRHDDGTVLRQVANVEVGSTIITNSASGRLVSTVTEVQPATGYNDDDIGKDS